MKSFLKILVIVGSCMHLAHGNHVVGLDLVGLLDVFADLVNDAAVQERILGKVYSHISPLIEQGLLGNQTALPLINDAFRKGAAAYQAYSDDWNNLSENITHLYATSSSTGIMILLKVKLLEALEAINEKITTALSKIAKIINNTVDKLSKDPWSHITIDTHGNILIPREIIDTIIKDKEQISVQLLFLTQLIVDFKVVIQGIVKGISSCGDSYPQRIAKKLTVTAAGLFGDFKNTADQFHILASAMNELRHESSGPFVLIDPGRLFPIFNTSYGKIGGYAADASKTYAIIDSELDDIIDLLIGTCD